MLHHVWNQPLILDLTPSDGTRRATGTLQQSQGKRSPTQQQQPARLTALQFHFGHRSRIHCNYIQYNSYQLDCTAYFIIL
jgi:hypothetical protein